MRAKALVVGLLLLPLMTAITGETPASIQAAVIDDFTDGQYTSNPAWTVRSGSWSAAANYLVNSAASASITTLSTATYGTWTFRFGHDTTPGINNAFRFYFAMGGSTDCADLTNTWGYYFFSNSGAGAPNTLRLLRADINNVRTPIIDTTWTADTAWHNIQVDWTPAGGFTLRLDSVVMGTATDTTYSTSSYLCLYNSGSSASDTGDIDDIAFTTFAPPQVTVSAPNGGESWTAQSAQTISWSAVAGTNPLQANSATITYSSTGCSGSFTNIATGQPTTGSYSWSLPTATTTNGCIKVSANDNGVPANPGSDTSNAVFSIVAATAPTPVVSSPNGGESFYIGDTQTIYWNTSTGSFPLAANPVTLTYSTNGQAGTYNPIASNLAGSGSYAWNIPNAPSINAFVKVQASDDRATPNTGTDTSNAAFSIVAATPPSVTVTRPNGGEGFIAGTSEMVTWAASNGTFPLAAAPVSLSYSTAGAGGPFTNIATGLANTGSYSWTVPNTTSANAFLKVDVSDDRAAPNIGTDSSNAPFSIGSAAGPSVVVTQPNGGENLPIGSAFNIVWTATPGTYPLKANPIAIHLSVNGTGGPWTLVAQNLTNSGSYSWNVPANVTCTAAIRVRAEDDQPSANVGADYSDSNFCIVAVNSAPQVTLASPAQGALLRGQVKVEWDGSDVNGDVVAYKVQSSADSGATWIDRANVSYPEGPAPQRRNATVDTTLIADRLGYWFRVNGSDPNGSSSSSQVSNITIDNTPPSSIHDQMVGSVQTTTFTARWKGTDATSGIVFYDVLVSVNGSAAVPWMTSTTLVAAPYNGTDGGSYGFTFIATDRAGNREAKSQPDIIVVVDSKPPTTKAGPLPASVALVSFPVPFTANDLPVNGSVSVELYYRSPTQQSWAKVGTFNSSPAQFTSVEAGLHEFYCIGTDGAGNVETKAAATEAQTFVDLSAPVASVSTRVAVTTQSTATFDAAAHDSEGLAEVRLYDSWSADNISYTSGVQAWDKTLTGGPKDFAEAAPVTLSKDGHHRIEVYARDISGRETRGVFTYIRLDTVPPTVVTGDPSKADVPTDAHVKIKFSEAMKTAATEAAVKVEGTTSAPSSMTWSQSDSMLDFDLIALGGNTTVKISVGSGALDLAGNPLVPYEFSFTTIPTTGAIGGKVLDTGKRPISGAAVVARGGGVERHTVTAADGSFSLRDLEPGVYEVSVSAVGYKPAGGSVTVVTAQTSPANFILDTELSLVTIGLIAVVAIVALALLLGLVVLARRRSQCPSCKGKLRNGRCANCGYVKAREPKKGRAPVAIHPASKGPPATMKTVGRKVGPWGAPVTAGTVAAPPPGANVRLVEPVQAAKRSDTCMACGAKIPPGEDWCPKCGQAVGSTEDDASVCPQCNGGMLEGTCLQCGFSFGGHPEVSEEPRLRRSEESCPRCQTSLKDGARFCASCGADVQKLRMEKEPVRLAPTIQKPAQVTPPPQSAPQLPVPPLTIPTPTWVGAVPPSGAPSSGTDVNLHCPTCGTLVPKDLPICDVCGEPLRK